MTSSSDKVKIFKLTLKADEVLILDGPAVVSCAPVSSGSRRMRYRIEAPESTRVIRKEE